MRFPGPELGEQHPQAEHHGAVARHESQLTQPGARDAPPLCDRYVLRRRLQQRMSLLRED